MISIGDRLQLNARGPILFAEEHGADPLVRCSWMDPMGQWHVGQFASADLCKLPEDGATVVAGPGWSRLLSRVGSFVSLW